MSGLHEIDEQLKEISKTAEASELSCDTLKALASDLSNVLQRMKLPPDVALNLKLRLDSLELIMNSRKMLQKGRGKQPDLNTDKERLLTMIRQISQFSGQHTC